MSRHPPSRHAFAAPSRVTRHSRSIAQEASHPTRKDALVIPQRVLERGRFAASSSDGGGVGPKTRRHHTAFLVLV